MIKANELRIGNWVQHEPYKDELWRIDFKLLEAIYDQNVYVSGIPLTPEILEKAGFEKIPHEPQMMMINTGNGYKGNYKIHYSKKNGTTILKNAGGKFIRLITINYVHQLQNLYFALTGEEIAINITHAAV